MNSDNTNQKTVQVAAGLMQEAELSYANVVAENEQLKAKLATAEAPVHFALLIYFQRIKLGHPVTYGEDL
ncbi:hypothetical protein BB560_003994 [Smittium megazygosporum]|uniref:Uncharacterized protein n=1 Tax=Smittium megazygosporum TaxID=133381 RepID=A0A2T9ZAI2_9FUNG|nr:hypothetical protein BB560_003994 [Smittium megazygosporum]